MLSRASSSRSSPFFGLYLDAVINAAVRLALFVLAAANEPVGVVGQVVILLLNLITFLVIQFLSSPGMASGLKIV